MIRPEAMAFMHRWHEVVLSGLGVALGLWLAGKGGIVLLPLGLALAALAAAFGILAFRRLRFAGAGQDGPGLVEIDEGEIRYFSPDSGGVSGGVAPLRELTELRLIVRAGQRLWRLRLEQGALEVPVDAAGAEALFDALSALPGMDSAGLVAALEAAAPDALGAVIWRRPVVRLQHPRG